MSTAVNFRMLTRVRSRLTSTSRSPSIRLCDLDEWYAAEPRFTSEQRQDAVNMIVKLDGYDDGVRFRNRSDRYVAGILAGALRRSDESAARKRELAEWTARNKADFAEIKTKLDEYCKPAPPTPFEIAQAKQAAARAELADIKRDAEDVLDNGAIGLRPALLSFVQRHRERFDAGDFERMGKRGIDLLVAKRALLIHARRVKDLDAELAEAKRVLRTSNRQIIESDFEAAQKRVKK